MTYVTAMMLGVVLGYWLALRAVEDGVVG